MLVSDVSAPLRSNRDFTIFLSAQGISALGGAFAMVAVPLLVLAATGSVVQMGLLTATFTVGTVLSGPFCGLVVDRVDRRRLMIFCDLARVVLFGVVPVCWAIGPQVWLLYVVMALSSVFDMLFQVAYVTAVPNLVRRDQIVTANGRLQAVDALAYVLGPALAGMTSAAFGPTVAMVVNAASFAVSAVGLVLIRRDFGDRSSDVDRTSSVFAEFREGVRYLFAQPVLRAATVQLSVVTFLAVGMTDIFIYYTHEGLGQGDQVVGWMLGLASVGAIVGAMVAAVARRRLGFGACWISSYALCGLGVGAVGYLAWPPAVTAVAVVFMFGSTLAGVCSMSLRQEITPDRLLGRVTSSFWTIQNALGPLGVAVLTALVGHFGVRGPLLAVGLVFVAVAVAASLSPLGRRDPAAGHPVEGNLAS